METILSNPTLLFMAEAALAVLIFLCGCAMASQAYRNLQDLKISWEQELQLRKLLSVCGMLWLVFLLFSLQLGGDISFEAAYIVGMSSWFGYLTRRQHARDKKMYKALVDLRQQQVSAGK